MEGHGRRGGRARGWLKVAEILPEAHRIGIIGATGRIGDLLLGLAAAQGWHAFPVGRTRDTVGLSRPGRSAPLVVCTRNDDLGQILEKVHPSRRADLVFVQNGMVQPWLAEHGLADCTQGVLYVAVPKVGDTPVGGGVSVFKGRWAEAVAGLLAAGGIPAAAVDDEVYAREVAVKLAWICIFGLLGQATGALVGVLAESLEPDVRALCAELQPLLALEPGLDLDADALADRLLEYSRSIAHFPASLKEWRWRNGWLLSAAEAHGVELPLHADWLERAGRGLDGAPLPAPAHAP